MRKEVGPYKVKPVRVSFGNGERRTRFDIIIGVQSVLGTTNLLCFRDSANFWTKLLNEVHQRASNGQ